MDKKQIIRDIFDAIEENNVDVVSELLNKNPELLKTNTPFGSWLHVASSEGALEIVKLLVDLGLDINARGGIFNGSALNEAAGEGHIEIVKYLLEHGAELDTSEPDRNPLFAAIYGGHKDIVKLLLEHGIDASVRYTGKYMKNMDAYDFAIERGQKEIAAMLEPYRK